MDAQPLDPNDESLVRAYYCCFNERRLDDPLDFLDEHAKLHHVWAAESLVGPEGYREFSRAWLAAFPDAHLDVIGISPFGERGIQAELVGHGTHAGRFMMSPTRSFPPTGRRLTFTFRHVVAIEAGKIVESWLDFDAMAFTKTLRPE